MTRIAVVVGTTRPGRKAETVARWVLDHARSGHRMNVDFELLDIADFELPLLDEPMPPSLGQYTQEHTRRWAAAVAGYDGFVFVTPEYNHGIPGSLKNAIDFLNAEWADKAAGFVGYGTAGGTRAIEHLRQVLAELRVATVRASVNLSLFADFQNFTEFTPGPHQTATLDQVLDQVVAWSRTLAPLRLEAAS